MQEEGDENLEEVKERVHEHIVEQTVDVPVPQIVTKILEVVETIPQERIWCMFEEPQVAAKILEVIKVPQIDDFPVQRDATTAPQPSPIQATEHVEVPPVQYIDKVVVDLPVVLRR